MPGNKGMQRLSQAAQSSAGNKAQEITRALGIERCDFPLQTPEGMPPQPDTHVPFSKGPVFSSYAQRCQYTGQLLTRWKAISP